MIRRLLVSSITRLSKVGGHGARFYCTIFGPILGVVLVIFAHLAFQFHFDQPNTQTAQIVCITRTPGEPRPIAVLGKWYTGKKTYHLPGRMCRGIQKYITIYQEKTPWISVKRLGGFVVHYRSISELPSTYTILTNQTAYFLGHRINFVPENFFHFTKQVYFPLFHLIKSTNQLRDDANNIVFYPGVYGVCPHGVLRYHDINRYKYFLDILHVKNKLELSAFNDKPDPHQVCFKNAVFSSELFLDKASEATEYFMDKIGVSDEKCTPNILVILNRKINRRILNTEEIRKIGTKHGYDTRVVCMETLTLKEQAQLIHCTKVLAGITGAGLQWAFFMKNHSALVEIGHQQWPLFFTGDNIVYGSGERDVIRPLNYVSVVTNSKCNVNPKALNKYYEQLYNTKGNFSEEESIAIVNDQRNYNFWLNTVTSLGKMCDIVIDPTAFENALVKLGEKSKRD